MPPCSTPVAVTAQDRRAERLPAGGLENVRNVRLGRARWTRPCHAAERTVPSWFVPISAYGVVADRQARGTAGNTMVIAMVTPKPPVLAAIALLLLLPEAALAQARSSAAPSPRLSAPPTILPTITPSVGPSTPAAPSTSL